ncbi:N-acetylglucosamine-6-phosphate deacetylase [Candidatus Sumerlaeota bacterium]|nr:N-acetylglucosamine-6-phosphate deacetylase [Candidatus Sumerlaeota bacterium]
MPHIDSFICGRLFTPLEIMNGARIAIEEGRIASVEKNVPGLKADLDASRLNAAPGFIDIHIQGCGGCDFVDATPLAVKTIRQYALRAGCASFLATTTFEKGPGGWDHLQRIVESIRSAANDPDGARILGIHLEGPYLNIEKKGGFGPAYFRSPGKDEFLRVLDIVKDDLKMITIAPELEGADEIIDLALSRKIIVALGHTRASYDQAKTAFDKGVNNITHIFNAMDGLHHRNPGLLGAALEDDRVFVQLIPDGVHIHPALMKILYRLKGIERICLITDATAPCGMPDGFEVDGLGGRIRVENGTVRLPDGTLAGSALLMDEVVRRFHRFTGVSLAQTLCMSSLTPAMAIGLDHETGNIREGFAADFALFDDKLKIHYVIVQGNVIEIRK